MTNMVSDTDQVKVTNIYFLNSNFSVKRLTCKTHDNVHLSFADLIEGLLLSETK